MEKEITYQSGIMNFLYSSPWTRKYLVPVVRSKKFAQIYGLTKSSPISKKEINEFVKKYKVDISEFEEKKYRNFNEFFIRKFKPAQRSFPSKKQLLGSPAEGRLLAYQRIDNDSLFLIKGMNLNCEKILSEKKWAQLFKDGSALVFRLAPSDYHRFHFSFDCELLDFYEKEGKLNTVNPLGMKYYPNTFCENYRHISILHSSLWGKVAMVEIGGLCVGTIKQTWKYGERNFALAQEKGYFQFGGSTVVLFFEKGSLQIEDIILQNTKNNRETWVKLGASIGRKI